MKIKAYTLFTDSHKKFLSDYFLPTFPFRDEIELTILHRTQHCKTAEFETDGWRETMRDKARCFIEGIQTCNDNELFMFIDPDIQFFGDFYDDIIEAIKDNDVVWQNDVIGGVNTGFFAVRNNKKTRSFFKTVLGNLDNFSQEQVLANHLLNNISLYPTIDIKWSFLPERYWTYGHIAALPGKLSNGLRGHWTPESEDFSVPKDIVIHHANWTSSMEYKFKLLDIVKQKSGLKVL
jgi:hypothetical protein